MKILIVDDNPENIEMMSIMLKSRNYKVTSAGNGREALEKLRSGKYDLIISDILMPVMDGFQLCRECKKDVQLKEISFIFYTATYIDDKDEEFALTLGARKFIRKPQEPEVFLNLVKEVIEKSDNGKSAPEVIPELDEKEILKLYSERLVTKLEKRNIELENEIASHKITESTLKESEEKYKTLFTFAQEAIFIADVESGILLDCNESACALIDRPKEEIIGKHQSFIHPPDELVEGYTVSFREHFTGEPKSVLSARVVTKSGTIKDVEIKANILTVKGKKIIRGFFSDVTERKRAEGALTREQFLLNSLIETIPDSIYFKDNNGHFIRINNTLAKRFGLNDPGEALDKTDNDFYDDKYSSAAFQDEQRIIATGGPLIGKEEKEVWPDGHITWVSTTKMPLKDKTGKIIGIMGISRDITDRKHIEEILIQNEADLKKAQKVAHISSWKWHIQSGKIEWSDEMFSILGIDKKTNMVDLNEIVQKAIHPDDRVKVEESNKSVIQNKAPVPLEYRIVLPDSSVRTVWAEAGELLFDKKGRPILLTGIVQDITERKQAEDAIRKSEEKYRSIFENVQDVYYETLLDGTIVEVSPSIEIVSGGQYHREDVVGKSMYEFYADKKDRDRLIEEIKNTGSVTGFEARLRNRDGSFIWCSISAKAYLNYKGQVEKIIGSMHDITKRKLAEKRLIELSLRQEAILSAVPDIIMEVDNDKVYTWANKAGIDFFGEDVIGKEASYYFEGEQDTYNIVQPLFNGNVNIIYTESWQCRKDGEKRLLAWWCRVLKDEKGKVTGALSSARDITWKMMAEEALRESEKKYRELIDGMNETVWVIDFNGNLIDVNNYAIEVFGYSKEELLRIGLYGIDRSLKKKDIKALASKMPTDKIQIFETTHTTKDGKSFPVEVNSSLVSYKGKPAILSIARDITARKQMEEKLEQERILLRTLIDNLPVGIYIKDKNMRKVLVNPADLSFIGKPEAEVLGKDDSELFHPDMAAKFMADDKIVIESGQAVINREELVVNDLGQSHWLLTSKLPLRDRKGNITGLIGIGNDITDLKQAQELLKERECKLEEQNEEYQRLNKEYFALNEELTESLKQIQKINKDLLAAKEKAEGSDKLKSAFLANLSHEIRTPMNSIIGFSGLLTKPSVTIEKRNEYVQIVNSSSQQLLGIINDILDLSKIQAGQLTITNDLININDLVYHLYLEYREKLNSKEVELVFKNEKTDTSQTFSSDGARLKQILSNLLSNAVKYTNTGTIEMGYSIKGNQVEFYVRDTGIGIAPEHQQLIFERFRQVETGTCRQYGGAGLGLSISKAIAERLGGSLGVESEQGKGSTFFLTMPYKKEKKKPGESKSAVVNKETVSWKGKTILIVEDEESNYYFLSELLAETGADELHAWDGIEAVDYIKTHPEIDLALMDIKMPHMDGYEATRLIKELRPDFPVIAVTAYAMSEDKEKILRAGFTGYVSKPFQKETFWELISGFL